MLEEGFRLAAIAVLAIALVVSGTYRIEYKTKIQVQQRLLDACEAELPRSQRCKLKAVPRD